jgi:malate dehydrogenase (oxaloacetate-decarboxylating)(NADP+)
VTSKIVASGAGAAALACLNLLVELLARAARTSGSTDIEFGVVVPRAASTLMDRWKDRLCVKDTEKRVRSPMSIGGADVFLGSVGRGGAEAGTACPQMADQTR